MQCDSSMSPCAALPRRHFEAHVGLQGLPVPRRADHRQPRALLRSEALPPVNRSAVVGRELGDWHQRLTRAARPSAGSSPVLCRNAPTEGGNARLPPSLGCMSGNACPAAALETLGFTEMPLAVAPISSIVRIPNAGLLAHTGRRVSEPLCPAMPLLQHSGTQPNHSIEPTAPGVPASAAHVKR